jgi:hypothetical protein
MPALGILTCEILELEFAHLLISDSDIQQVTVVENEYSEMLTALLEASGLRPRRVKRSEDFVRTADNGLEVLIRVLELGLHNRKHLLQEGLTAAGKKMGPRVDALLLGYGLCGNALADSAALLAESGVPVFIPWDEDHPVDDCVGLVIGGRENYAEMIIF